MVDPWPDGATVHSTSVQVRYAETDQQGVAYHAHYLVWMEVGRTAFLEALGFPYRHLEEEGVLFSVVEASCRYLDPARYADRVEIATRVTEVRSRMVVFGYRMTAGGRTVAWGETRLVALGRDRRPCRIPADVGGALRHAVAG
ncbi:MAG: acyl-CoA thioesterase [Gemmatimonadota bacterium]